MLIILAMRFLEYLNLYHVEVVEHACGMGTLQMGEYVSNVSNGVDTYSVREPIGVCAGICPFNFPAMIPLWVRNLPETFSKNNFVLPLSI
jgi:malonate-semialdehyde dehydrogenase (acetylating)/methylmalonate-semialdehyde dehydrogenase